MPRETYVFRDGQVVDKARAAPLHQAHGSGPNVIRDGIDPMRSMADGQLYDSRSTYLRSLKEQGCEVVGNERSWIDQQPSFKPQRVGDDIKRAIQELESR